MAGPQFFTPQRSAPSRPSRRFSLQEANRSLALVKRIVADIVTTHQQAAKCQAATEKARGRDQSKAQAELDRTCDRLQDLVDERHAAPWFGVYYLAVALGTLTLLVDLPLAFRLLAGAQLFATVAIIRHLYRSRELLNVPPDLRRGFARPHPFLPQIARKLP